MSLPYEHATSGRRAIDDIKKILNRFGVDQIAEGTDYRTHTVVISFSHKDRRVKVEASAQGWCDTWLKANPYSSRMKRSLADYRAAALAQGHRAVCSMLRDWIKGQVTAIETGLFTFEAAFMGQMIMADGRTVAEKYREDLRLAAPAQTK
jgi:hypothetical protein